MNIGHNSDLKLQTKTSHVFDNGDSFVGKLSNGLRNGFGHYTWNNGNYYAGEFKDGLKHGYGYWRKSHDANSNQYKGEFMNDKKWGYGEFKWSSGNYYKGNYKNDEREGYGEMYWTDRSIYKGIWHNGIQHGAGTMFFSDGTFIKGCFNNNVFLSENKISEKQSMSLSRQGDEIEAHIYNLPSLGNTGYRSVINRKEASVIPNSSKHWNSPKNPINKLNLVRRSIELSSPNQNNTFYISQNYSNLNSSLGKNRNTFNGFPQDKPKTLNKRRNKGIKSLSKSRRKYRVSGSITWFCNQTYFIHRTNFIILERKNSKAIFKDEQEFYCRHLHQNPWKPC